MKQDALADGGQLHCEIHVISRPVGDSSQQNSGQATKYAGSTSMAARRLESHKPEPLMLDKASPRAYSRRLPLIVPGGTYREVAPAHADSTRAGSQAEKPSMPLTSPKQTGPYRGNPSKSARLLGASPSDTRYQYTFEGVPTPASSYWAGSMLNVCKAGDGSSTQACEQRLPAFPTCREALLPYSVLHDSVRKLTGASSPLSLLRKGRFKRREFVLSTTCSPSELRTKSPVISPLTPGSGIFRRFDRNGNEQISESMIHCFKQESIEECARLVLTAESYVTVIDDGLSSLPCSDAKWALKVAGLEVNPVPFSETGTVCTRPREPEHCSDCSEASWIVQFRSRTERNVWQQAIKALLKQLEAAEQVFRLGRQAEGQMSTSYGSDSSAQIVQARPFVFGPKSPEEGLFGGPAPARADLLEGAQGSFPARYGGMKKARSAQALDTMLLDSPSASRVSTQSGMYKTYVQMRALSLGGPDGSGPHAIAPQADHDDSEAQEHLVEGPQDEGNASTPHLERGSFARSEHGHGTCEDREKPTQIAPQRNRSSSVDECLKAGYRYLCPPTALSSSSAAGMHTFLDPLTPSPISPDGKFEACQREKRRRSSSVTQSHIPPPTRALPRPPASLPVTAPLPQTNAPNTHKVRDQTSLPATASEVEIPVRRNSMASAKRTGPHTRQKSTSCDCAAAGPTTKKEHGRDECIFDTLSMKSPMSSCSCDGSGLWCRHSSSSLSNASTECSPLEHQARTTVPSPRRASEWNRAYQVAHVLSPRVSQDVLATCRLEYAPTFGDFKTGHARDRPSHDLSSHQRRPDGDDHDAGVQSQSPPHPYRFGQPPSGQQPQESSILSRPTSDDALGAHASTVESAAQMHNPGGTTRTGDRDAEAQDGAMLPSSGQLSGPVAVVGPPHISQTVWPTEGGYFFTVDVDLTRTVRLRSVDGLENEPGIGADGAALLPSPPIHFPKPPSRMVSTTAGRSRDSKTAPAAKTTLNTYIDTRFAAEQDGLLWPSPAGVEGECVGQAW
ncbi:unnamed protein product [Parajaminaea phylloscopi]